MQNGARSSALAHEKDGYPTRQGHGPDAEDHGSNTEKFTRRKINSF
jgi:hypothetical protein